DPVAEDFTVLGRRLVLESVPAEVRRWLDRYWNHPGHDIAPHPATIRLTWSDAELPALGGEPVRATVPGASLHWHRAGSTLEWRTRSHGIQLDIAADSSRIRAWSIARPDADFHAALYLSLTEAVRASGLVPLHAAIAVPPGESHAVAITGQSGTGKSTTLLRLAALGWRPLAEDLSWLDPATFIVHRWDRGIRLWPESLKTMLPHLASASWTEGTDGKLMLDYASLGEGRSIAEAPLGTIALLEQAAGSAW